MTIKEVEQCLNVPRATIRFYEKEGLLSPVRGENRYREYSEEDVVKFEKATLLEYFGIKHSDGRMVDEFPNAIIKVVALTFGFCATWCLLEWIFGDFTIGTLREALFALLSLLVVEAIVAIPSYFYLRKHPNAKKKAVQLWMAFSILVVLLVVLVVVKVIK